MRIVTLAYEHRFGKDTSVFRVPDGAEQKDLPELTDEFMKKLGFSDPELSREDESAEWGDIVEVADLLEVPIDGLASQGPTATPAGQGYSAIPEIAALQRADLWGEHDVWTREEWQVAAGCGDTQCGYWAWVEHRIESAAEAGDDDDGDSGSCR